MLDARSLFTRGVDANRLFRRRKPGVQLALAALLGMALAGSIQAQPVKPAVPLTGAPDISTKAPALAVATSYLVKAKDFTVSGSDRPGAVLSLVLVIETTGNGSKDIPWTITDGATEIASGIERGVPANKTIEARAEFRPAAGPGVLHLRGNVDPRNTLHEPGNELGNNVSRVVDKAVNVPGLPVPVPGGSSESGTGTANKPLTQQEIDALVRQRQRELWERLHPNVIVSSVDSIESGPFNGTDFLERGSDHHMFNLKGENVNYLDTVVAHGPQVSGVISHPCGNFNCLALLQAAADASATCGYREFSLNRSEHIQSGAVPTIYPHATTRVFVTPWVRYELSRMAQDENGRAIKLALNATQRKVTSGDTVEATLHYDGGVAPVQADKKGADAMAKAGGTIPGQASPKGTGGGIADAGGTIEMSTSHPNNVRIEAAAPALQIVAGKPADLRFKIQFTHTKAHCLNGPVEITARVNGGPSNGDKAVTRLFIIPK
jgi:hypothetical protein